MSSEQEQRIRVDADVEAINRGREAIFRAFNATDLDGFMAWVTNDAVFMDHGGPPALAGKEAIRSSYKSFFDRMTPNLTPTSDEIVVSGEWAFDRGTWVSIKSDILARSIWNGADVPLKTRKTAKIRRKPKGRRRK